MKSVPEHTPVTQADIARALGIADSTVSRALKNNPKIPEEHRRHIQQTAEKMGYRLNSMASALAHLRQPSSTVQAALAWLNLWPIPKALHGPREFRGYWEGAKTAAEKMGYALEEFVIDKNLSLSRVESVLKARGIRGVLIPPHPSSPNWENFGWSDFSVVRYGRSCTEPRSHLVASDQMQNVLLALKNIRQRGYSRVGFVTGLWSTRRGGWMKGAVMLDQADLPKRLQVPMLVFSDLGPETPEMLHERCLAELAAWAKKYKPEAIFTDVADLREMLLDVGLKVPEDVALAGHSVWDGDATAGIDQHPEEIGRVGILVLISLINSHECGIPRIGREILVSGKWVDGDTLPILTSAA